MPLDNPSSSMRSYDQDGRLHVRVSHITKACINPYRGIEIPNCQQLGLDPDKVYRMLRDPAELQKAAATFNNLQILDKHTPVTAADPHQDKTVGSTGSNAVWNDPYIDNSLVFWKNTAIAGIETEMVQELSASYHYDPDMTPGTFKGEPYDGVMRNIRGNHVALVEDGRAGRDVVVMDEALQAFGLSETFVTLAQDIAMPALSPKGVAVRALLINYLTPRLKPEQKLPAMDAMLKEIKGKNWDGLKKNIATKVAVAVKPVLAEDANIDALMQLLGTLDSLVSEPAPAVADPDSAPIISDPGGGIENVDLGDPENTNAGAGDNPPVDPDLVVDPDKVVDPNNVAEDDDLEAKIRELLTGKLDDADLEMLLKLIQPDPDPGEPDPAAVDPDPDTTDPVDPDDDTAKDDSLVTPSSTNTKGPAMKPAMDAAAIQAASAALVAKAVKATTQRLNERTDAEKFVRPFVGELQVAMDSAEDVYRFALDKLGVKTKGVHPSAFRTILENLPKPGSETRSATSTVAMDAAGTKTFFERFPAAARMRVVG